MIVANFAKLLGRSYDRQLKCRTTITIRQGPKHAQRRVPSTTSCRT